MINVGSNSNNPLVLYLEKIENIHITVVLTFHISSDSTLNKNKKLKQIKNDKNKYSIKKI
jgi:hypothetical protein